MRADEKWRWHSVIGHDLFLLWMFQRMGIPEAVVAPDTSDALKVFRCWSLAIGGQHQPSSPALKIVTGTDYQSGRVQQAVGCRTVLGPAIVYTEIKVDRLAKMIRNSANRQGVFYGDTRSRGLERASGLYLHMTRIQDQVESEIRGYSGISFVTSCFRSGRCSRCAGSYRMRSASTLAATGPSEPWCGSGSSHNSPALEAVFGNDIKHRTSKFKNNHLESGTGPSWGQRQHPTDARLQVPAQCRPLLPSPRGGAQFPAPGNPAQPVRSGREATGDPCPESRCTARHAYRRVIREVRPTLGVVSSDLPRHPTEPSG